MDVIAIETLLDEASSADGRVAARKALAKADVIIAVDADSQNEFTIYGTPSLEETVRIDKDMSLRSVRVMLSDKAVQLDKLLGLVRAIKGSPGYVPE
jgi:hypothetical protein